MPFGRLRQTSERPHARTFLNDTAGAGQLCSTLSLFLLSSSPPSALTDPDAAHASLPSNKSSFGSAVPAMQQVIVARQVEAGEGRVIVVVREG
jgi:hypothetical protein